MDHKLTLLILAGLVCAAWASPSSSSRVRRQGFGWRDDADLVRPTPSTPALDVATTTKASVRFMSCIRSCPTTPEYNPVCASNRVTYDNESKMKCANRCGLSVTKVFGGTCSPL